MPLGGGLGIGSIFGTNKARASGPAKTGSISGPIGGGYSPPPQQKARQTYSAPKQTYSSGGSSGGSSYSGGSSSYSGGGSSGGSSYDGGNSGGGGGGVEAFAAPAPVLPPPPVMEDVTIPDPLSDPTYQRQKAELLRAKADFDAQRNLARSQYDTSFNDNMREMGWRQSVPLQGLRAQIMGKTDAGEGWDPNARGTAYGDAYMGNEGDFAGRGLYNSGLYAQEQANLGNEFNNRRGSALNDQKNWRDTQDLNLRNFEGQQNSTDLSAQSDAIAAIAARLGVDIGRVTPGKSSTFQREKVG